MKDKEIIIELKNVEASFTVQKYGINNFKNFLFSVGIKKLFDKKEVLKGINLKVYKGDCLGLMGMNGCGKSTLLRTIAGIIVPDKGELTVNGTIAPMMALGAGLESELTGQENIRLLSKLMGKTNKQIDNDMIKIVAFSELSEEAINMEVKRYSQGMMARLAFSISVATTPEILIIDEALTVGDLGFQKKCAARIDDIMAQGSTVIYVTHNMKEIQRICNRAIYMEDGVINAVGSVQEIADLYAKKTEDNKSQNVGQG